MQILATDVVRINFPLFLKCSTKNLRKPLSMLNPNVVSGRNQEMSVVLCRLVLLSQILEQQRMLDQAKHFVSAFIRASPVKEPLLARSYQYHHIFLENPGLRALGMIPVSHCRQGVLPMSGLPLNGLIVWHKPSGPMNCSAVAHSVIRGVDELFCRPPQRYLSRRDGGG